VKPSFRFGRIDEDVVRDREVMAGRRGLEVEGEPRAHERVVVDEHAARLLGRGRAEGVELELLVADVHHDVTERVDGSAVDRLEAERRVVVGEPVPERAGVPLAVVELEAVVVGGQHLVPVEVDRAGARLGGLHRVAEADDLVVADDVSPALHVDAVVARVRTAVVRVDEGPDATLPTFRVSARPRWC